MIGKRKLGRQGLEVSALGLGCMGMTMYGVPDDQESIATIHRRFPTLKDGMIRERSAISNKRFM